jgi:phosphatidylserine decarboxylase
MKIKNRRFQRSLFENHEKKRFSSSFKKTSPLEKRKTMIKSPTFGTVEKIGENSVLIYIDIDDPHGVYAPVSGTIRSIRSESGVFKSPKFLKKKWIEQTGVRDLTLFTVEPPKTERLWFEIESETIVLFYVEIGHPQYVTNNVALYVDVGKKVESGEHLGEILVGSRAKIYSPKSWKTSVKKGQKLEGGKTTVFERAKGEVFIF